MFKGYEEYDIPVCRDSEIMDKPCIKTECQNHYCHVPRSQSGTEYYVKKLQEICPLYQTRAQRLVRQYGRYFRE